MCTRAPWECAGAGITVVTAVAANGGKAPRNAGPAPPKLTECDAPLQSLTEVPKELTTEERAEAEAEGKAFAAHRKVLLERALSASLCETLPPRALSLCVSLSCAPSNNAQTSPFTLGSGIVSMCVRALQCSGWGTTFL